MSDGQITNGQRAAHALDGINAHSRSSARQELGMSEEHFFFDFDRDTEPGADYARLAELLWGYRFAFGYEKAGLPRPGPSRSQKDAASPAELAGRNFPASAGQPLGAPAESRLAVTTSHRPRALNQAHGRHHR